MCLVRLCTCACPVACTPPTGLVVFDEAIENNRHNGSSSVLIYYTYMALYTIHNASEWESPRLDETWNARVHFAWGPSRVSVRERTHAIFKPWSTDNGNGTERRGVHEEKAKQSCFVNGQLTAFCDINAHSSFNGTPSYFSRISCLEGDTIIVMIFMGFVSCMYIIL